MPCSSLLPMPRATALAIHSCSTGAQQADKGGECCPSEGPAGGRQPGDQPEDALPRPVVTSPQSNQEAGLTTEGYGCVVPAQISRSPKA